MSSDNPHPFWGICMEKLLPYLDVHSVLKLAQSEIGCTLAFLENTENLSLWEKMTRRTLPDFTGQDTPWVARYEETRDQVLPLVALLKMMEDPTQQTLSLLHHICEKSSMIKSEYPLLCPPISMIQLSCPCGSPHRVAPRPFLLLELVETRGAPFWTTFSSADKDAPLQEISVIEKFWLHQNLEQHGFSGALAARVTRQRSMMTRLSSIYCQPTSLFATIWEKENAAFLFALMKKSATGHMGDLHFEPGTLDEELWSTLALSSTSVKLGEISCSKEEMKKARREDLRKVFQHQEAAGHRFLLLDTFIDGFSFMERSSRRRFATFEALNKYLDG